MMRGTGVHTSSYQPDTLLHFHQQTRSRAPKRETSKHTRQHNATISKVFQSVFSLVLYSLFNCRNTSTMKLWILPSLVCFLACFLVCFLACCCGHVLATEDSVRGASVSSPLFMFIECPAIFSDPKKGPASSSVSVDVVRTPT